MLAQYLGAAAKGMLGLGVSSSRQVASVVLPSFPALDECAWALPEPLWLPAPTSPPATQARAASCRTAALLGATRSYATSEVGYGHRCWR